MSNWKQDPATEKQQNYIQSLISRSYGIDELDHRILDLVETPATKGAASDLITILKKISNRSYYGSLFSEIMGMSSEDREALVGKAASDLVEKVLASEVNLIDDMVDGYKKLFAILDEDIKTETVVLNLRTGSGIVVPVSEKSEETEATEATEETTEDATEDATEDEAPAGSEGGIFEVSPTYSVGEMVSVKWSPSQRGIGIIKSWRTRRGYPYRGVVIMASYLRICYDIDVRGYGLLKDIDGKTMVNHVEIGCKVPPVREVHCRQFVDGEKILIRAGRGLDEATVVGFGFGILDGRAEYTVLVRGLRRVVAATSCKAK